MLVGLIVIITLIVEKSCTGEVGANHVTDSLKLDLDVNLCGIFLITLFIVTLVYAALRPLH